MEMPNGEDGFLPKLGYFYLLLVVLEAVCGYSQMHEVLI